MIIYRGLHYIFRHITALDNRIMAKMQAAEKAAIEREANKVVDSLPEKDRFFSEISIITHAGGGLQGLSYLNSKDAFSYYYENGNRVFEYDIDLSEDGKYICTHVDRSISESDHMNSKIDHRFSPISMDDCLCLISKYKDIKVVFDCKFCDLQPFAEYVKSSLQEQEDLSRVVIQVFSKENIDQIRRVWNFKMLYVCMNNTDYIETAKICVEYNIGAVSISDSSINNRAGWNVFINANICTFIYTVNTVQRFIELKEAGLCGAFSDFLFEKDVKET